MCHLWRRLPLPGPDATSAATSAGYLPASQADFNVGSISHDNSGFTGGGQIGCDYQWAGGWVIGFRNMFNGTSGGGKTVTLNGFQDRSIQ